jgi:hypothetical protein
MDVREPETTPRFWRVTCHTGHHPGQWQRWFREQCCGIGWPPPEYSLRRSNGGPGWNKARNALSMMRPGDSIIASLPGHRVGRIGTIVALAVDDDDWAPLVPQSPDKPFGENGRRIIVRWDLACGPDSPDQVVLLPKGERFSMGQARASIKRLPIELEAPLRRAMTDPNNWVSLIGQFRMDQALSDYIALHPGRIEAGMVGHPDEQIRERSFSDRTRSDVILQDRHGVTVLVECKQHAPTIENVDQVLRYRDELKKTRGASYAVRLMLVHGGSRRVDATVAAYAREHTVDLVYHELRVEFSASC